MTSKSKSKTKTTEDYEKNPYVDIVMPAPGKKGRSKIVLNELGVETIGKLAAMGCTRKEICAFMGLGPTASRNEENAPIFDAAFERASEIAKVRIRQAQYKCLDNGNSAVTIFMSKAVLGMTDGQTAAQPNNMFADFLAEARKYAEADKGHDNEP